MTDTRQIMTTAWTIAREAADQFGDRPAAYIREALRMAWASARRTRIVDTLLRIGNEWQAGDKHRIYFNDLAELMGLETTHYRTGSISGATLGGRRISNNKARALVPGLAGKLWYDVADGRFHGKGLDQQQFDLAVAGIKRRAACA